MENQAYNRNQSTFFRADQNINFSSFATKSQVISPVQKQKSQFWKIAKNNSVPLSKQTQKVKDPGKKIRITVSNFENFASDTSQNGLVQGQNEKKDQGVEFNLQSEGNEYYTQKRDSFGNTLRPQILQNFKQENRPIAYSQKVMENFRSLNDVIKKREQFNSNVEVLIKKMEYNQKFRESMVSLVSSYNKNIENPRKPLICNSYEDQKASKTQLLHIALDIQEIHKTSQNDTFNICFDQNQKDQTDCFTAGNFVLMANSTPLAKSNSSIQNKATKVIKQEVEIKDERSFYSHGRFYQYSKNSLGIFSNKTRIRKWCVYMITAKPFDYAILIVILFNSILLGLMDYTGKHNDYWANTINNDCEILFTCIFTIEAGIKIIAMGLILEKKSYLQDPWNWIDFTVVVTSLLQNIPQMKNVSGLRTFRLFRPLKSLSSMPSMRILVGTLLSSVSQIGGILLLQLFFFLLFAILGITLWSGLVHYRCRMTPSPVDGDWLPYQNDTALCGSGRQCLIGTCGSLLEAKIVGFNLSRVDNIYRDSKIPQLNYGLTNFDNIGYAFITIYQCITTDQWTSILNMYQDAYSKWFASLYFISCIIVNAMFLFNLTIAVMLKKYEELGKNDQTSKHKEDMRILGRQLELPDKLIDFIIESDKINSEMIMKKSKSLSAFSELQRSISKDQNLIKKFCFQNVQMPELKGYYSYKITRFCYKFTKTPFIQTFMLVLILINTLILGINKYPFFDPDIAFKLIITNYIFSTIFIIEQVVKLIGLGFHEFKRHRLNIFDLIIVVSSVIEIFISTNGTSIVTSFRALRLFRLIGILKMGDLKILIDSISYSLNSIVNYCILLIIFFYVYSLIGMQFFAGQLRFDQQGNYDLVNGDLIPRNNFDNLYSAILTVIQCFIGFNWIIPMQMCANFIGLYSAIYFITLNFIGYFILLKLFLAILLGNFTKARDFNEKKKFFLSFRYCKEQNMTLNQAIDQILDELSFYVKTKILNWDPMLNFAEGNVKLNGGDSENMFESNEQSMNNFSLGAVTNTHKAGGGGVVLTSILKQNRGEVDKQVNDTTFQGDGEKGNKFIEVEEEQKTEENEDEEQNKNNKYRNSSLGFTLNQNNLPNESTVQNESHLDQMNLTLKNLLNASSQNAPQRASKVQFLGNELEHILDERSDNLSKPELSMFNSPSIKGENNNHQQKEQKVGFNLQEKNSQGTQEVELNSKRLGSKFKLNIILPNDSDTSLDVLVPEKKSYKQKHMTDSSLFIFNKHWRIRQWCIILVTPPESFVHKLADNKQKIDILISPISTKKPKQNILTLKTVEKNQILKQFKFSRSPLGRIFRSSNQIVAAAEDSSNEEEEDYQKQLENQHNFAQNKKKKRILPSQIFDNLILVLIILSSIIIVIENPLYDPHSQFIQAMELLNSCFTILFMIEALIKIIALGFLYNNLQYLQPYMRNSWNIIDFIVVMTQFIDIFSESTLGNITKDVSSSSKQSSALKSLKALRALRALRPLRMIGKNEELRIIVNSLFATLPSMANVLFICCILLMVFGIIGIELFKGRFFYCSLAYLDLNSNPFLANLYQNTLPAGFNQVVTKFDCLNIGGTWTNSYQNFDNLINAMTSLFAMMTTEGWTYIMYNGADSTQIDYLPQRDQNGWMVIYFIGIMVIGFIFLTNLFVGVVIDNFNLTKEKEELGNIMVTDNQRSWIEIQKLMLKQQLQMKINQPSGCRKVIFKFVNTKTFENIIFLSLFLNIVVSASKYYSTSITPQYDHILEGINQGFSIIFNIELAFKLISFGMYYFHSNWNIFDFLIIISTDIGFVFDLIGTNKASISTGASIIRGFRIIRIFRLMRSSKHFRIILDTVRNILPQIGNVMTLMFLVLYIYSALGIYLFSGVLYQVEYNCESNFRNFGNAMLLLFRCSTGEKWYQIMTELANQEGYNGQLCNHYQTYDSMEQQGIIGCGNNVSYAYFFSFIIIVSWLIMNLSIAVVIQGLDSAVLLFIFIQLTQQRKENMGIIEGDHLQTLLTLWKDYDPKATGWITQNDLIFLLYELPQPLGKQPDSLDLGLFQRAQEEEDQQRVKPGRNQSSQNYRRKYNNTDTNFREKKGSALDQQDRYLLHTQKQIIISQLEALQMMKDLSIGIYINNGDKQIHFKNVFKGLIKRVYKDKDLDYRLAPHLNNKMNRKWLKRFKDIPDKRPERTVRQEQALQIITKWIQKQKRSQQANFILNRLQNHQTKKQKAQAKIMTQLEKEKMHQILRESLSEIFGNSHSHHDQIEEYIHNLTIEEQGFKDQYTWMHPGGEKLLNKLHTSCLSDSFAEDEEEQEQIQRQKQSLQILMKYSMQSTINKQRMIQTLNSPFDSQKGQNYLNIQQSKSQRISQNTSADNSMLRDMFKVTKDNSPFGFKRALNINDCLKPLAINHQQTEDSKHTQKQGFFPDSQFLRSEQKNSINIKLPSQPLPTQTRTINSDSKNNDLFEMNLFKSQMSKNIKRLSVPKKNDPNPIQKLEIQKLTQELREENKSYDSPFAFALGNIELNKSSSNNKDT